MDYAMRDSELRPSSRRTSPYRRRELAAEAGHYSGRTTPSAAVRRALQVLDESYRHQCDYKRDFPLRVGAERNSAIRRMRSPSPLRSRTPSPVRKFLRESPTFDIQTTPPKLVEIERDNLQDALGDSESRRNVLLRKLAETQRTMEIQNDTIRKGELELGETKATTKLMLQLQTELETKVQYLEKEKNSLLTRQIQDAEERETLRREAESFHHESKRLQCQLDLYLADKEEYHREMDRAREDIRNANDDNKRLMQQKSALNDEVAALRENLHSAKQRIELLDKEKEKAYDEVRNMQESQRAVITRNTELSERLNKAEDKLLQLQNNFDETEMSLHGTKHDLQEYTEKCSKQGYKLAELQTTHKEMRGDFERSMRYSAELERTLQSLKSINQELKQSKVTLEDNLTSLHADLAKSRLDFSRASEERTRFSEELDSLRRAHKEMARGLEESRRDANTKNEEFLQAEAARKIESQRSTLMETQKTQTERELSDLTSRLVSLQQAHEDLRNRAEENSLKSAKEIQRCKDEIEKMEAKNRDVETRLERTNMELSATVEHDQSQLDHWRETCTKLTVLIEERDRDQRDTTSRLRSAEEASERAESRIKTLEMQVSDNHELQHEINELKNDNKRLAQECKENHQMIAVLEMERDVLAKSPSKSTTNADDLGAEVKKLHSTLQMAVDKMTSGEVLKTQHANVNIEDKGLEELEANLRRAQESNRLLGEQLTQVKKEAESMQNLMEARDDTHERELRKMEREKERLETRIRSLEEEARVLRSSLTTSAKSPTQFSDAGELRHLKFEVDRLKRDIEEKEQSYLSTKGQLVIIRNAKQSADDKITNLESKIDELKREKTIILAERRFEATKEDLDNLKRELLTKTAKVEAAEAESSILKARVNDLTEVRTKQDQVAKSLRAQLKEARDKVTKMEGDSDDSEESITSIKLQLVALQGELHRSHDEIATKDEQLTELKNTLAQAQKQEQKARQERDELKGKTIVMESITDSSTELRKELDHVRQEKMDLEKQINSIVKSKTSQTPHTSMSLDEDLDREMEKQYKVVCERNKWLENRISSLLREIDLLRDQNSLLLDEKNAAERQMDVMEGELKTVRITTKSSHQQKQLEQIHLQNSNAEKMHQILEMQREIGEKNQLIRAMSKQLEAAQKKSDKKKISAFMKKLKKSGDTGSSAERTLGTSSSFAGFPSAFTTSFTDPGYSTLSLPGRVRKENNGAMTRSSSTPGDISKLFDTGHSDPDGCLPQPMRFQTREQSVPELPETMKGLSPSPTLTMSARRSEHSKGGRSPQSSVRNISDYVYDSGAPIQSPYSTQVLPDPPRKKGRRSRRHEETTDSASDDSAVETGVSTRDMSDGSRKRSSSLDRSGVSRKSQERRTVASADELESDRFIPPMNIPVNMDSSRSADFLPNSGLPIPATAPALPTPASSPSVLSPTSARNRSVQIRVTGPNDERTGEIDYHAYSVDGRSKDRSPPPNSPSSLGSPLPSPPTSSGDPVRSKSVKDA